MKRLLRQKIELLTRVQILDDAMRASLGANTLEKDVNPSVLSRLYVNTVTDLMIYSWLRNQSTRRKILNSKSFILLKICPCVLSFLRRRCLSNTLIHIYQPKEEKKRTTWALYISLQLNRNLLYEIMDCFGYCVQKTRSQKELSFDLLDIVGIHQKK